MTTKSAEDIGTIIGKTVDLGFNVYIAYSLGHEFHSFAIGWGAYIVLSALSAIAIRLNDLKEKI